MARHVLKVMLMFKLMDSGRLPLAKLSEYLESVPVYREYNQMYLGLTPAALADSLVDELERSGAVAHSREFLVPVVRDV